MKQEADVAMPRPWQGVVNHAARGHVPYTDDNLIERALRNVRPKAGEPWWSAVSRSFAVGSTVATYLCIAYGLDPDA